MGCLKPSHGEQDAFRFGLKAVMALPVGADLLPQVLESLERGIVGAPFKGGFCSRVDDLGLGVKVRLSDAQVAQVLHGRCGLEYFDH